MSDTKRTFNNQMIDELESANYFGEDRDDSELELIRDMWVSQMKSRGWNIGDVIEDEDTFDYDAASSLQIAIESVG